jgi:hypothetical protein
LSVRFVEMALLSFALLEIESCTRNSRAAPEESCTSEFVNVGGDVPEAAQNCCVVKHVEENQCGADDLQQAQLQQQPQGASAIEPIRNWIFTWNILAGDLRHESTWPNAATWSVQAP